MPTALASGGATQQRGFTRFAQGKGAARNHLRVGGGAGPQRCMQQRLGVAQPPLLELLRSLQAGRRKEGKREVSP